MPISRDNIKTAELRALLDSYGDPLQLNFKLLIDWKSKYGLFADEKYINSALAYLKRIGQTERYELLKVFIATFNDFVRLYDYLFLSLSGISEIITRKPGTFPSPTEDWQLQFTLRETIDFKVQALITMYRHIWYDDIREVEVLPVNLRMFNCSILIYSYGYFSNLIYGLDKNETLTMNNLEKGILPTVEKLENIEDKSEYHFNYVIADCFQCQIDTTNSAKSLFDEISNEMNSEQSKTNLVVTYRLCSYRGMFRSVAGNVDFGKMLVVAAALNKQKSKFSLKSLIPERYGKRLVEGLKKQGLSIARRGLNIGKQAVGNVIGKQSVIGHYFDILSKPEKLTEQLGNIGSAQLDKYIGNYAFDKSTGLANMAINFEQEISSQLMRIADRERPDNAVELQQPIATYIVDGSPDSEPIKNPEFQSKIGRNTF